MPYARASIIREIDSRDCLVRRSTRRATRAGSPRVRASFLRSSPGHIASRSGSNVDGGTAVALRAPVENVHDGVLLKIAIAHEAGGVRGTARSGIGLKGT